MSLPTAPKDISEHPTKGSVIDPVDRAKKDADVDRKIRLFGVITAFRKGRMPSNQQIDETLQYVLKNSPVDVNQLSPEGKKLIQDTRYIIETARQIVQDKNADELLQQFIWHTRDIDIEEKKAAVGGMKDGVPVPEGARDDGRRVPIKHLRTLLSLILTNSELIGRDLLSRSLSKAATGLAPDSERLARVDESAPNDQFVTEGGELLGRTKRLFLKREGVLRTEGGEERPLGDVHDEASRRAQELREEAMIRKEEGRERAAQEIDDTEDMGMQRRRGGVLWVVLGICGYISFLPLFLEKDNMRDRIPQQHKERANEHTERARKFLSEEYFPEERRDQFIFRGKKVILECQKHQDYQSSIRWLLSFIETYSTHARNAGTHASSHTSEHVIQDPQLRLAVAELRTILERFANGQSMDVIFSAVERLAQDSRNDEELRAWFGGVDTYVRKVLLEPGYVLEPDCNTQARKLREDGRRFFDDKYRGHFDSLFDALGGWFRAMGDDPMNAKFGQDWARLTKDLLFDDEGNLKFKPELWSDIRKVILPQLIDKIGYIPIPRIEYTDDALDLVFSPYNAIADETHHNITLTLDQMQADMRDVAFYYNKKSGIPKMKDSGIADVILGGEGLCATVHLVSSNKDKTSIFKVKDVVVRVDSLKFKIRDSKHDFLYKTLGPLATGLIKKQIQKALRDAITTGMEYVDGQLVGVRDRMQSAKVNEGESRTEVLASIFKRKQEEASIKSSEKSSQFKVVSDKRKSLLADAGNPAGWVNMTSEKKVAASRGEEWRSEACVFLPFL
ncbi:hypothetical protein BDQ17DRAFT_1393896 [Cyathus striatus]|nr:hypothetical protein BDQ17DRAFT_1393896 [Cyathus striatus]